MYTLLCPAKKSILIFIPITAESIMKCPWENCAYIRQTSDDAPKWQCPSCKTAYNKHPDYLGILFFEISLEKISNLNKDIRPEVLYLSLNKDLLAGLFINKTGSIQKIEYSKYNLTNINQITNSLKNEIKFLCSEQEREIFIASAKYLNHIVNNHNTSNSSYFRLFFLLILLMLSLTGYIIFTKKNLKPYSYDAKHSYKYITSQMGNSYDSILSQYGLDLEDLDSKLNLIAYHVQVCSKTCEIYYHMSSDCKIYPKLYISLKPQLKKYYDFLYHNSIDGLNYKNKQLVHEINERLGNIKIEEGNAIHHCNKQ